MTLDLGLADRVCVVTGSTSGIGLVAAQMLADEGAKVVVCGRDPDRVERARLEAGAALGVVCDLAEPTAPQELIDEATRTLGPVDCLVNNVGVAYQADFEELTDEQWDEMWQLNVMSFARAIRAVAAGDARTRAAERSSTSRPPPASAHRPRCRTIR